MQKNIKKKTLEKIRKNILENIITAAYSAGASSAHLGGALSMVDIINIIFSRYINLNPENINNIDRDYFILSKGHACLAYYSMLAERKFFEKKELKKFEKNESPLLGHPVLNKKFGIDFSTGSLGMGIGIAVGLAIGLKKKESNNHIYVVMGDGECNEGSVWESFMSASNFKLNNLTVVIDHNKFQQTGSNKEILDTLSLKKKMNAFGFQTTEVDGHNFDELETAFQEKTSNKPRCILANTTKGKYLSFSENNNKFHHAIITKALYDQAIKEIGELK